MKKLLTLGIQEGAPDFLNKKIRAANLTAIILTVFSLLFYLQISRMYAGLTFLPLIALGVFLFIFVLNFAGQFSLARFLLSVGPLSLLNVSHAYLLPADTVPIGQTMAMTLAVLVLPFLLFDYREIRLLSFTLGVMILQVLLFPKLNEWLQWEGEFEYIDFRAWSFLKDTTMAIIILCLSLYIIVRNGYRFEKDVEKANRRQEAQYEEMEKSRKELEYTLAQVEESQREEKKRTWASNGMSELNKLIRSVDDLDQVYDEVLSWIVGYLESNQGNLYILEENDRQERFLQLKAAYAYNRKKYIEKTIEIGQGLVGQCYLEKEEIYLTEIPQNYVYITSGLGKATPDALLIVPLIVNEKVEGILELASFKKFEEHQIDFLKAAGENIASTIARHRISVRTRELLEESQYTTEQMRAQEEEMRQNMEEFNALQEEMLRKEKFYMKENQELKEEIAKLKQSVQA